MQVAHVIRERDSDTIFKVKRSRSQGAGAYWGGSRAACFTLSYERDVKEVAYRFFLPHGRIAIASLSVLTAIFQVNLG